MNNIEHAYLGQRLLERGFEAWALYIFRLINRTPFICEPLHHEMFRQVQDVIDGKTTRLTLNMSPRTGKTTTACLLCAYTLALNPSAQIIYTSFNQDLLAKISKELAAILQHPAYQAMYPAVNRPREEISNVDPIDEFWREQPPQVAAYYLTPSARQLQVSVLAFVGPQASLACLLLTMQTSRPMYDQTPCARKRAHISLTHC